MAQYIDVEGTVRVMDGDSVKVTSDLRPATYRIDFSPTSGYSLEEVDALPVRETMYGNREKLLDHIDKSYHKMNRSMGVLLSGAKGIGKTMFVARLINKMLREENMPIILANRSTPGLSDFIDTALPENCIVLFDEFEKTFRNRDDENHGEPSAQEQLLSLFDGTSNKKRLYIFTINDVYKLNNYFVNRPGRVHYHIRFKYPTGEEVSTYLKDNVDSAYWSEIERVVWYASLVPITYDVLRAIAFELNLGSTTDEAMRILNIPDIDEAKTSYRLVSPDTKAGLTPRETIELNELSDGSTFVRFRVPSEDDVIYLRIGKLQKVGRELTVEILNFDKEKEEFESKTEVPFFTSPKMKLEEVSAGPNTGIRGLI